MENIKSLCVFCGSRLGSSPAFEESAKQLGEILAKRNIRLVYGGGGVGIMRVVAETVIENGGQVTGIIPKFLMEYEVGNVDGVETTVVESMHERKNLMFEHSDAFVILPGGIGTLDETMEIMTWKQLQVHAKPIILVNQNGFWDPLIGLLEQVIDNGFAHPKIMDLFTMVKSVDDVMEAISEAPQPDKIVLTSHL
ncbi:MAG: TIGR00730 family Rossman fold protein [Rhodospirillales bacterium]|nr:TIGR00730 family Rossman fold protein [Rhodospirillales bacterium]